MKLLISRPALKGKASTSDISSDINSDNNKSNSNDTNNNILNFQKTYLKPLPPLPLPLATSVIHNETLPEPSSSVINHSANNNSNVPKNGKTNTSKNNKKLRPTYSKRDLGALLKNPINSPGEYDKQCTATFGTSLPTLTSSSFSPLALESPIVKLDGFLPEYCVQTSVVGQGIFKNKDVLDLSLEEMFEELKNW